MFKKGSFGKCGRVIDTSQGTCRVIINGQAIALPPSDLCLISVRNIPNLRLVHQKLTDAASSLASVNSLGHAIMGYLGGGSVVAIAFADYILKAPDPILAECLAHIQSTHADIPHAIDRVLGLNFQFVSGK